mgnify:CR=1 FL=1
MKKILLSERIFIAGSTGMAGGAIFRALKNAGYGRKENGGIFLTPKRDELDLLNRTEVFDWFSKNLPTVVVIAAAKVGGIYANSTQPVDFLLDNLKIQTNLIEASWMNKVKRLIFLGSSCIYPKLAKQPIKEEYLLSGPLEKTNECYALAKIAGIKLCEALRIQYKFDSISLMPTNLYGPGDNYHPKNSHVMAALIKKFHDAVVNSSEKVTCWGTGSPYREFLHVDDLGESVVFCLEKWDTFSKESPKDDKGDPLFHLNVGTGKDISIKDLALKIANLLKFKGEIVWDSSKPDGTPKKQLDISRITELGWRPSISLDEGIESTVLEYKKLFKIES